MFGPSLLICAVTEPMYYGSEKVPCLTGKRHGSVICRLVRSGTITGQMRNMRGGQYVKVGDTY